MKARLIKGKRLFDGTFGKMILAGFSAVLAATPCFASTITLHWGASTGPDVAGYKVYYKADSSAAPFNGTGAVQGASPVDVSGQLSTTVTGLDPDHAYYFAITAYNSAGVESPYSNIVPIAELTPPSVAITSPGNSATASGTVSVSASASDNVGVTRLEFYVNGALQSTDTTTPYLYSWNTSALAAGSYALSAKAYDAAGNVGTSGVVSVTVVNDTTAPAVSLTAPGNGAIVSGTVAVTASASDNVGVSRVEFYQDGALLSAGNVSPYSYSWNTSTVANGSHTLSAKAYDAAGNVGQSASLPVTVKNQVADSSAPVVSAFTLPATASSLTVQISGLSATDNVAVTGYLVSESSTAPAAGAAGWSSAAPSSFSFAGSGARTAYAFAKDAAGNVSTAKSAQVTITLPSGTTTASLGYAPASGGATVDSRDQNVIDATKFTVPSQGGTATTAWVYMGSSVDAAPHNQYQIAIYSDNTSVSPSIPGTLVAISASGTLKSGWNSIPVTASLKPNTTYWLAYNTNSSVDSRNNLTFDAGSTGQMIYKYGVAFGSWPSSITSVDENINSRMAIYVTYAATSDTTPPVITAISPAAGSTVGSSVTVKGSATDNVGVTKMEIYLDNVLESSSTTGSVSWTWNTRSAAKGAHVLTVKAYDAAGNVASQSETVKK